jgi:hypothetical protein
MRSTASIVRTSTEALPALRTVFADKQGPLEPFPPSLWERVEALRAERLPAWWPITRSEETLGPPDRERLT